MHTSHFDTLIGRFPDRLKLAIGSSSVRTFATDCGLSEAAIRKYLNGKSFPTLDRLVAIAENGAVSIDWLATGRGEHSSASKADEFIYIDNWSVQASAGSGAENGEEIVTSKMAFRRDWINSLSLKENALAVIQARGDSMEPAIMNGDTLLLETYFHKDGTVIKEGLSPNHHIGSDGIYTVRLDGHLIVKRLQQDMQGGLYIKSDNPTYDKLHIKDDALNDLHIVGKVVWVGREL